MHLFLVDNVLVNVAQLPQADVVFAEHVEEYDPERVDVRFEAVDALLAPHRVLLGRREAQSPHARRQLAEHCAF